MLNILLAVANTNQSWIDKYANLNTFIGLIIGVLGLVLSIYFYRKQKSSTNKKQNLDIQSEYDIQYLSVSTKVDHVLRKFVSYGASEGEIIQAGNFRANYEVEAELTVTIQNESPNTFYGLEVGYIPNEYSKNCKLIDSRQNKLAPLEGNNHVDFTLRIMNHYYDVYASDVDKDIQKIYKLGKEISLLNGSKLIIKYKDYRHQAQVKTEVIE